MEWVANIHIEKLPEGVYLATSEEIPGLAPGADHYGDLGDGAGCRQEASRGARGENGQGTLARGRGLL
jgi:hypothetical protein